MPNQNYINRVKNFRFKHSLGQNFLVDENVIGRICDEIKPDDYIFEIGAGAGFVTEQAVKFSKYVRAVEIDKSVISILRKNCENKAKDCDFEIIEGDILKLSLRDYLPKDKKFKVIANIPYYITSPILAHLLGEIDEEKNENRNSIDEIILMVQYEVAKRLVADNTSKNIKDYGLLSILAQFRADVEIIEKVSKRAFFPSPRVDSALVRIKIKDKPIVEINSNLKRVIRAAFATRRKNIKNCLNNAGFKNVEATLEKCGIAQNARGETLSLYDFSKLSKELQ